jgi:TPR repeat protein
MKAKSLQHFGGKKLQIKEMPRAQFRLSYLYMTGDGVEEDYKVPTKSR